MAKNKDILFLDMVPYHGGSKEANSVVLDMLKTQGAGVTVLCRDECFWLDQGFTTKKIREPKFLEKYEEGYGFFLKHIWVAMLVAKFILGTSGRPVLVGGSGPGVDFSLYLLKSVWDCDVVQFVHGPVASSRTIAWCLTLAKFIYYVPSSKASLVTCLERADIAGVERRVDDSQFIQLNNGLSKNKWPTKTNCIGGIKILWAASLLKWKRIEVFLDGLNGLKVFSDISASICFIRPKGTCLDVSPVPEGGRTLNVYESPSNLDEIRSGHNVFVSTSENEPFGLSILEALAAGLCVVIPEDGAHWDRVLEHGVNCIKYKPGSSTDLGEKLFELYQNDSNIVKIGEEGYRVACCYRAEKTYRPCVEGITQLLDDQYIGHPRSKELNNG